MRKELFAVILIGAVACTSSPDRKKPDGGDEGSAGTGGGAGAGTAGRGGTAGGAGGMGGAGGSAGAGGSGGSAGSGGSGGAGGSGGTAGRDGGAADTARGGSGGAPDAAPDSRPTDAGAGARFSFFVTSLEIMRELSGSQNGFGGNLGGLMGADSICQRAAAKVGAGGKTWRAFLSSVRGGPNNGPIHAIDRIGEGPWYDRNGRVVSMNKAGLLAARPMADPAIVNDLPNERGEGQKRFGDNHDVVTGSNRMGRLNSTDMLSTCNDWTYAVGPGTENRVMLGHSWPRSATNGIQWITEHTARGCAPGVNLVSNGAGTGTCIGCGGGYGGIYCFALQP